MCGRPPSRPAFLAELEATLVQTMADVATIGILQERAVQQAALLAEQLEGALNTPIVIEQAKGVLSERLGSDLDEVFSRLRRYARNHNRRLVDVAGDIVTGHLPTDALGGPLR